MSKILTSSELLPVLFDFTSISVVGLYLPPPISIIEPDQITYELEEPIHIKITRGYSRDRRPDLKQFMINLLAHI